MRDFKRAIEIYDQCLKIYQCQPQTLIAIGYCHHQIGETSEAIDFYHRAHFLKKEDLMLEQLVHRALEDVHHCPIDESYFNRH